MDKKIFSENCNLSNYTTIKVGGVAEYFAEPRNLEEFSYLIKWANLNKQRCQIIGAGSNLLINNILFQAYNKYQEKDHLILVPFQNISLLNQIFLS